MTTTPATSELHTSDTASTSPTPASANGDRVGGSVARSATPNAAGITQMAATGPRPTPSPTPRPAATATPPTASAASLADQLEAAAAVIRAGIDRGRREPASVTVSAAGNVEIELDTEILLEWGDVFATRPQVVAYHGSDYLHFSGAVEVIRARGGRQDTVEQVWDLHAGNLPEPDAQVPWRHLAVADATAAAPAASVAEVAHPVAVAS